MRNSSYLVLQDVFNNYIRNRKPYIKEISPELSKLILTNSLSVGQSVNFDGNNFLFSDGTKVTPEILVENARDNYKDYVDLVKMNGAEEDVLKNLSNNLNELEEFHNSFENGKKSFEKSSILSNFKKNIEIKIKDNSNLSVTEAAKTVITETKEPKFILESLKKQGIGKENFLKEINSWFNEDNFVEKKPVNIHIVHRNPTKTTKTKTVSEKKYAMEQSI